MTAEWDEAGVVPLTTRGFGKWGWWQIPGMSECRQESEKPIASCNVSQEVCCSHAEALVPPNARCFPIWRCGSRLAHRPSCATEGRCTSGTPSHNPVRPHTPFPPDSHSFLSVIQACPPPLLLCIYLCWPLGRYCHRTCEPYPV